MMVDENILITDGKKRGKKYTYYGLPEHSSLAIMTKGTLDDPEARRLFVGGVDALVRTKHPCNLIVCRKYPSWIANNIKEAFEQVTADNYQYSPDTHRDGQVIILSKYPNLKTAHKTVWGGYRKARRKVYVHGNVLSMHGGRLYKIGGK